MSQQLPVEMDVETAASDVLPKTPQDLKVASNSLTTEDSGYHTPFTSSFSTSGRVCSSSANSRPRRHPSTSIRRRLKRSTAIYNSDSQEDACKSTVSKPNVLFVTSPSQEDSSHYQIYRRSLKRSFDHIDERINPSVSSTPTTSSPNLTSDLERLHVESPNPPTPIHVEHATSDYFSLSSIGEESSRPLSYPTTPVKSSRCKIARLSPTFEKKNSTKKSPSKELKENIYPRISAKKLTYERVKVNKPIRLTNITSKHPVKSDVKRLLIIPDKKFDIIHELNKKQVPALELVLGHLNGADLYHFSNVCILWRSICNANKIAKSKRDTFVSFMRETKENSNAKRNVVEREVQSGDKLKLRSAYLTNSMPAPPLLQRTPPGTPRTNKLRHFYKSASQDGRMQLPCVRCCHPAKVNMEDSGEQWVQCLSKTCYYSFCRYCKCQRHPDSTCHSIDAPSPTKRRKCSTDKQFDSKKCRKNLRRLMES